MVAGVPGIMEVHGKVGEFSGLTFMLLSDEQTFSRFSSKGVGCVL